MRAVGGISDDLMLGADDVLRVAGVTAGSSGSYPSAAMAEVAGVGRESITEAGVMMRKS